MKNQTLKKKLNSIGYKIGNKYVGILFEKFSKVLPVKRIEENDRAIAFWHPKPVYEKHILIVPKKTIENISSFSNKDFAYIQDSFKLAKIIIKNFGWEKKEYKLLINGGKNQKIKQFHFHLISGKEL